MIDYPIANSIETPMNYYYQADTDVDSNAQAYRLYVVGATNVGSSFGLFQVACGINPNSHDPNSGGYTSGIVTNRPLMTITNHPNDIIYSCTPEGNLKLTGVDTTVAGTLTIGSSTAKKLKLVIQQ